ncbi:L-histidine N(alpha)-methyltransferase [Aquabacterium sp.]|uniref:L-histidine N(alpha)-methyltransferase n=1 Tax=Aquabacterium sp. TaxID=1872578 RepID=UPI003784F495
MIEYAWAHRLANPLAVALLEGLRHKPRAIAPKFFYDARGSALFDQICDLPEYYPTRTELGLLQRHAREMAECIGPAADVVEFGAGSQRKIRLLLQALQRPARYVPVDISTEHLREHARALQAEQPGLPVQALAADFSADIVLPPLPAEARRRVGFFPGSSIGNFTPAEALQFLRRSAAWLRGGGLLIGVDLVKDPAVLHAAYNDAAGVTAAFNKNLLLRANRELGTDFDAEAFHHHAFYDPRAQRIEMHLISARRQTVRVFGERFLFDEGESLHTENSCKYTVEGFQHLAREAGYAPQAVWCDAQRLFSVHWLAAPAD